MEELVRRGLVPRQMAQLHRQAPPQAPRNPDMLSAMIPEVQAECARIAVEHQMMRQAAERGTLRLAAMEAELTALRMKLPQPGGDSVAAVPLLVGVQTAGPCRATKAPGDEIRVGQLVKGVKCQTWSLPMVLARTMKGPLCASRQI